MRRRYGFDSVRRGRRRRGPRLRWPLIVGVALASLPLLPGGAGADAPPAQPSGPIPNTPESREADEIFQQLLKDPKNVDLTFRYAEAAIKAGNIEAGISSLERLLLLDRNFPGVKLELAELYARLKSYDMAKAYLDEADKQPGNDPKTLARIKAVRDEIENAGSPSQFSGTLLTGMRYQSDASAEPAGSDIIAGGVPQTLSTIFINKPAADVFGTGNLQHVYDFGSVKLESNALAYYSRSIDHPSLDLGALELNTGPRFDVDVGQTHLVSARPYALGNDVTLGDSQFLHSLGGGLSVDRSITEKLSAGGFYEFRAEWFSPVTLSPAAPGQNAHVHSLGSGLSYRLIEDGNLNFQVSYAWTNTLAPGLSNTGLVFHLSYSQLFHLPEKLGVGPLSVSPFVYRIFNQNDGPTPAVIPAITPFTNEWRYGGTIKLGLTDNIAANLFVVRSTDTSNIPTNRVSNTQAILGLIFAF